MSFKLYAIAAGVTIKSVLLFYFRKFLTALALRLISGAASRILGARDRKSKLLEVPMGKLLEGNEVEKDLGKYGKVVVDVDGDGTDIGKVRAGVDLAIDEEIVPKIPGALKVKGKLELYLDADPVALALHELNKLDSGFAKMVAAAIAKLRAGDALPAHVQAAVSAHVDGEEEAKA